MGRSQWSYFRHWQNLSRALYKAYKRERQITQVVVHEEVKESKGVCKLLGVYLDQELRYKDHARKMAVKGIKGCDGFEKIEGITNSYSSTAV